MPEDKKERQCQKMPPIIPLSTINFSHFKAFKGSLSLSDVLGTVHTTQSPLYYFIFEV